MMATVKLSKTLLQVLMTTDFPCKHWRYQWGLLEVVTQLGKGQEKQWPKEKDKGQTMIYKTLRRKLKIEQHEPH